MAKKQLGYRQKKSTAALVVSIIELVAVLGLFLGLGISVAVGAAKGSSMLDGFAAEDGLNLNLQDEDWLSGLLGEGSDAEEVPFDQDGSFGTGTALPEDGSDPIYCPHCGWELYDETVTVCDGCGLDPNVPAEDQRFYCAHCGSMQMKNSGSDWCSVCGYDYDDPQDVAHCTNCGVVLSDLYADHCDTCGYVFEIAPAAAMNAEASQVSKSEMQSVIAEKGYAPLYVYGTWESSIVDQKGTHNNSASALVDGDLETSWQEGVSGDGLGESVTLDFGGDVEMQCIEMYLGNHRTDEWFYKNNVPQQVTVVLYGAEDGFYQTFTVNKETYERGATCVMLNMPVKVRYMDVVIDSVYK